MTGEALRIPMKTSSRRRIVSMNGEEKEGQWIDNKKHHYAEIEEAQDGSPIHIDISKEEGADAQETVQDADPREIPRRTEMADTLLLRRIIDTDRHRHQRHIMPSRKDKQFQLRFVTTCDDRKSV